MPRRIKAHLKKTFFFRCGYGNIIQKTFQGVRMSEKFEKQLEFIALLDNMKSVYRRTLLIDKSRRETDAEHSFHIAVMAMVFEEYAEARGLSILHIIKMLLVHDLVEIYAGDTFCYDAEGYKTKQKRERDAADRIFPLLGDKGAEMRGLWEEFETCETDCAHFAAALDVVQPFFNNYYTDGYTWEGKISKSQVLERLSPTRLYLPEIWPDISRMIDECVEKGLLLT